MGRRRPNRDVLEFLESGGPDLASVPQRDRPEGVLLAEEFKHELPAPAELEKRPRPLRRGSLTKAPDSDDYSAVTPEARRESGPDDQARQEDQLRELLANPRLREFAKQLIAEAGQLGTREAAEEAGSLSSLMLPKTSVQQRQSASSRRTRPAAQPKPTKEQSLLREGPPLIEEFACLWDQRETLPQGQFVERLQSLLDRFHEQRTLGSFELNKAAVQWVNTLAKKRRITLLLGGNAVTLKCNNTVKGGYFVPRQATGEATSPKGSGSKFFPRLSTISRVAS